MPPKFKDKRKKNKAPTPMGEQIITRVRTPRDDEVIGIVEQRVGANRMIVKCLDGKERNCRIPGALRRRLWIRPGNTVIVRPWEFEGDKKGDVLYKYTPAQVEFLKRKGFMREVSDEF
ncbi:translation initiation factor eIF-1A [archaeon]|jgi:translation initiation factor 1A|nr:translation initiation factor eIF-1A [archaeon]MBT4241842.1 translation initiation factor eIF-1A [archaeon]MBT4418389.1 translation initiation factor eIF-1A [archaeon]